MPSQYFGWHYSRLPLDTHSTEHALPRPDPARRPTSIAEIIGVMGFLERHVRLATEASNASFSSDAPKRPLPTRDELETRFLNLKFADHFALIDYVEQHMPPPSAHILDIVASLVSKRPVPDYWDLKRLTKLESYAVRLRYGMMDHQDWTIRQIATRIKRSQKVTQRMLDSALLRLRGLKSPARLVHPQMSAHAAAKVS